MEELLSYNWNVYKLFSNGNRAKAPFVVIEGEDCESEGFNAMVRKNLEESKLTAKLGIFGDKNKRDDKTGQTNADIGAAHEFGVLTKKLPRRSFLLDPLTIKGKELTKETGQIIDKYIDMIRTRAIGNMKAIAGGTNA